MSNEENNSNEEGGGAAPDQKAAAAAQAKSPDIKSSIQSQKNPGDREQTDMEGVTNLPGTSDETTTTESTNATTTTTSTTSCNTTPLQPSTSTNTVISSTTTPATTTTTPPKESQSDSLDISSSTVHCLMLTDEMDASSNNTAESMLNVTAEASLATDESLATDVTPATDITLPDESNEDMSEINLEPPEHFSLKKKELYRTTVQSILDLSQSAEASSDAEVERVAFKVTYDRKKFDVELPLSSKILDLKKHLQSIIDVPPSMQKVMIKGLAGDEKTLAELGVTRTSKVMVVGSTFNEVLGINTVHTAKPSTSEIPVSLGGSTEPLCTLPQHKKVLDKGPPEDVHPGIKGKKESLPPHPISGMVNKLGGKVRLTFKLELDQVWIGTKQRTEKINMNSIRAVVSEPIQGQEMYHIMGLQLGTTEASRYWLYWVPAQYVDAIKRTVMGSGF